MLQLNLKYSSYHVLLFMAQHGVRITPANEFGSSYNGCNVRQIIIETYGNKYGVGKIYTLKRRRKAWEVAKIEDVPKAQYEQAEAHRELEHAMHGVYTGLMRYNEYIKNQPKT